MVLTGTVAQDVQASGFDVDVEADTAGSVYAVGATVTLRGAVGQDLTAAAMTLRTAATAITSGNARLGGGVVTIGGAVTGALTAAGGEIVLDAPIGGDVVLQAANLSFGPAAKIGGTLRYWAPQAVDIPASVIAPDRVTFTQTDQFDMFGDMHQMMRDRGFPVRPGFATIVFGFLLTLAFLIALGAVFLALLPGPVERLRQSLLAQPGHSLIAGFLGLSCRFGLVPVAAMTLIGLPLVPVVLLAIVVFWTLGYILSAYAVASRLIPAFAAAADPTKSLRLLALATGVVALAVLNFIPYFGWIANVAMVLLGLGAISRLIGHRLMRTDWRVATGTGAA